MSFSEPPNNPGTPRQRPEFRLLIDPDFLDDLRYWIATDRKVAAKLTELLEAIRRDPFGGIGKPEPLKELGAGIWSRRITLEHRLVYRVEGEFIYLLQGRGHY